MAWFARRTSVEGVEARAGFLDRPVLAVLVGGLVLIVMIFGVMLMGRW